MPSRRFNPPFHLLPLRFKRRHLSGAPARRRGDFVDAPRRMPRRFLVLCPIRMSLSCSRSNVLPAAAGPGDRWDFLDLSHGSPTPRQTNPQLERWACDGLRGAVLPAVRRDPDLLNGREKDNVLRGKVFLDLGNMCGAAGQSATVGVVHPP